MYRDVVDVRAELTITVEKAAQSLGPFARKVGGGCKEGVDLHGRFV
ncbi:MAG: hypothetical protein OEQ53_13250 [Saprospiraceae bacterium]|nr:hypothetical protein [Saprospiraceae bacterium]